MFLLPLVHDRRLDRITPVAAVELTEADLRVAADALAADSPSLARRFSRLANDLRHQANQNGAAAVGAAPRPDQEVLAP